ncbi:xanthine dehydrogenase family protein subunit M [soil metagenome]
MTTLAPFEIHRATSVAEASALIEELGEEAVLYSGGTELLLLMKLGFASYAHLVDVKPIPELHDLEVRDGWLRIGAAVTHRRLERAPEVRAGWQDLAEMERHVANLRVRSTGSLGGNLAFADPHSDPATFLLAADARVVVGRAEERRTLRLDQFVLGPYATALAPGELLCAIEVPVPVQGSAMAHLRFAVHERPAATVSAWVRVVDGAIRDARVSVGSVGIVPVVVPDAAEALSGRPVDALEATTLAALGQEGAAAAEPVSDSNGSEDYKRALVSVLIQRAIREAGRRAIAREEGAA